MLVLAFTGAGISKQSGISTFMERPDVREKLFRDYANSHPKEYNMVIKDLKDSMQNAVPNDAHYALAEYRVPIITMNIDGLHEKAGSEVLALHGTLPDDSELDHAYMLYNKPVLYGDPAPNYQKAYQIISKMYPGDILLVIGCSYHTAIACDLRDLAHARGTKVIEINDDAAHKVRKVLEEIYKPKSHGYEND